MEEHTENQEFDPTNSNQMMCKAACDMVCSD